MATIAKFYLLDAVTPNTGTMPGAGDAFAASNDVTGDASGARTARDATDVIGTSNPDIESSVTANADTNPQTWGHRRFVSRPLAAHTFAVGDGNWTFSYARTESNLNHNQSVQVIITAWRPSTGSTLYTGSSDRCLLQGTEPTSAGVQQAQSVTGAWGSTSVTIQNGDILVFEVFTTFTQGMSTAYTEQFAYNGTTEGSTTTCASFVSPPAALDLFVGYQPRNAGVNHQNPGVLMEHRDWERKRNLWRPRRPKLWKPDIWFPGPTVA